MVSRSETEGEQAAGGRGSKLLPAVKRQAEAWHEAFGAALLAEAIPLPNWNTCKALHLLCTSREFLG